MAALDHDPCETNYCENDLQPIGATYYVNTILGILALNYHPKTSLMFTLWQFESIG